MKPEELKTIVRDKYGKIASQNSEQSNDSCCGTGGCCDNFDLSSFSDDYENVDGYNAEADFGLGCGLPTQYAGIKKGDHVLDLGSGAGNDCFVSRKLVGEEGKVTGVDFTDAMVRKANKNLEKTGYKNIDFIKGDIEDMPLNDNSIDVVISNCVINLVPDKQKVFSEVFRVLRVGGHFSVSDIVLTRELPLKLREAAEMYAGCVSGAIIKEDYLDIIKQQGFKNIEITKEKEIEIPDDILLNYITPGELETYKLDKACILSITVTGFRL